MTLWIDADACPKVIKDIVFRASQRLQFEVVLVANHYQSTPPGTLIRAIQVGAGFDVADNLIVQQSKPFDIVITADIPLAAELIAKQVHVLNPRGERYSRETIGARLTLRDFLDTLRGSGIMSGGPAPLSASDRMKFGNALDRLLAEQIRRS